MGKAAAISLCLTAGAFVTAKLNLFGLESASGDISDDIAQQIGLVSYTGLFGRAVKVERPETSAPAGPPDPDAAEYLGQDTIRVISIDEAGVKAMKALGWNGWPPGYDNLSIMVEDLMLSGGRPPRAVFLDFLITGQNTVGETEKAAFGGLVATVAGASGAVPSDLFPNASGGWKDVPACQSDPLIKLACMVAWGATPMILAQSTGPDATKSAFEAVALLSPIQIDHRNYPLIDEPAATLYPATALYAAHCMALMHDVPASDPCGVAPFRDAYQIALSLKAGRAIPADDRPTGRLAEAGLDRPLATVWSAEPHPAQKRLLDQVSSGDRTECGGQVPFLRNLFARAMNRPPSGGEDAWVCEYALWMGYDRLAAGYGLESVRDYPLLLADKLVIVGARFNDGNDWVRTPLHGSLPGVFYHAMSLDNLIEMGPRYRHWAPENEPGLQDALTAPLTFILMTMALYAGMARPAFALNRRPDLKGRLPLRAALPWHGLVVLAVLAVAAVYIVIVQRWADTVVMNWLGVLATVFAAMAATARMELIKDIETDLQRGPAAGIGRFMTRVRTTLDVDHEPDEPNERSKGADDAKR